MDAEMQLRRKQICPLYRRKMWVGEIKKAKVTRSVKIKRDFEDRADRFC